MQNQARRPAMTAPARDAINVLWAGTVRNGPWRRTKELRDMRASDDVTYQQFPLRSARGMRPRWRFGLPGACEHW